MGDNGAVNAIRTLLRACAVSAVIAVSVLLSGCASTVQGTATRAQGADPRNVPRLDEAELDDILLTIDELNAIVGATQMTLAGELDEMTDHSADVSDLDCLGAVFGAEEPVYT